MAGLHSFSALFDEFGNEAGPSSLMTGADTGSVVSMEVFVKTDAVAPVRILLKLLQPSKNRTPAILAAQKDTRQAPGNLRRRFPKGRLPTRPFGQLHFQIVPVEMMEFLE